MQIQRRDLECKTDWFCNNDQKIAMTTTLRKDRVRKLVPLLYQYSDLSFPLELLVKALYSSSIILSAQVGIGKPRRT